MAIPKSDCSTLSGQSGKRLPSSRGAGMGIVPKLHTLTTVPALIVEAALGKDVQCSLAKTSIWTPPPAAMYRNRSG